MPFIMQEPLSRVNLVKYLHGSNATSNTRATLLYDSDCVSFASKPELRQFSE